MKNRCLVEGEVRSVDEIAFKSGQGSLASVVIAQPVQKGQEWVDNPIEFSAFGALKEDLLKNCKVGMVISVDGTIQGRVYNDRTYISFRADRIEYIKSEEEVLEDLAASNSKEEEEAPF
jgi:single-stranded DNA-binding protein|tara:strand:+ start:8199 stop:8555 length:357 start_codon:yes stop_codon:yes gene_type:complete